jgi:type IV pilus assembly protein PilY1
MKKILFLTSLILVSITSFSEDIELYISEAVKQSNQKPQVLIIFDNSGSMGTELYVNEDYDPDELYPAVGGYNSLSDKFVYFTKGGVDGVGLPVPDSPSESRRFLYDINNCATARYLLETQGFYTGHLREYSMKGNTGTWNEIPDNNGANVEVIDCEDDVNLVPETYTPAIDSSINLGINPDTGATFSEDGEDGYPVNGRGNKQNPIYFGTLAESEASVSWSGQLVTIYTDNYLRWHHGETIDQTLKSRMDIAKDSVSNVIKSAPSIDFGLQVFNYNSSSNNSGGRIIAGIKEMTAANQADLLSTIDDLSAETWTPLCETLYEASLYFAGKAIDFGNDDNSRNPGRDTSIEQGSNYRTPFTSCNSKAYVILITDGSPTYDNDADAKINALSVVEDGTTVNFSGSSFPVSTGYDTQPYNYLASLAGWMNEHDINANLEGKQTIDTFTIGFSEGAEDAEPLLKEAALLGGGLYFKAEDSIQLTAALLGALENLEPSNDSLTSASVAANNFDRTETLNSVYYAMFEPQNGPRWQGNLKKYKVINGLQVGREGKPALDEDSGHFSEDVTSFWSTSNSKDGNSVSEGGVADMLRNKLTRVVYSDIGSLGALALLTEETAGTSFGGSDQLAIDMGVVEDDIGDYLDWAKGKNTDSEKLDDGSIPVMRPDVFGDPLHSKPLVINYGSSVRLLIGTNAGALHMFEDKADGNVDETWSFMPKEFFSNIKPLRDNYSSADKIYGIDGRITSHVEDLNGDGIINGSDKVWIFFGLRRGGSSYYALDISSPTTPKLLWHINSATDTEFSQLGQTWSQPKIAYSKLNMSTSGETSTAKPVLIFGAGYDTVKDSAGAGGDDSKGLGIYMVDAKSGTLKWSLTPTGDTTFSGKDSIPSSISTLDSDGDGLVDRLYTGDTGGNVWRVDMPSDTHDDDDDPWSVFKLASLGGTANATDRRFFNEASIARTFITETFKTTTIDADGIESIVFRKQEKPYDAILLGSGDRSNPLGIDTQDTFFMIKDEYINTQSFSSSSTPVTPGTIIIDDLYNYTDNPFDLAQTVEARNELSILVSEKSGWYINLTQGTQDGEKNSATAIVINGIVYFTTFTPPQLDPDEVSCELPNGQGWLYAVDLALGTHVYNWQEENSKNREDRIAFISEQYLGAPTLIVLPEDDGDDDTADDAVGNIIVGRKIIPVGFSLKTLRTYLYVEEN